MNPPRMFFLLMLLLPTPAHIPAPPPLPDETAGTITHPCDARVAVPPAGGMRVPAEGEVSIDPKKAAPIPLPTPLSIDTRKKPQRDLYLHAFEILKEDNSCGRFFGGPATALRVLNKFAERLEVRRVGSTSPAIMMSGRYTNIFDNPTGAKYRLFEEMTVNSDGPLSADPAVGARGMFFGRFRADTKRAKVLALLHELGHLIRGADGAWLLPNDGHDKELSLRNTKVVESRCIKQLLAIKD